MQSLPLQIKINKYFIKQIKLLRSNSLAAVIYYLTSRIINKKEIVN